MQVFSELKRRNVLRVGTAYGVVSWLILQVLDVIAPILLLPDWVSRLVLLLIAVGFIPALVFAWAFELTPEGLKRDRDVNHDSPEQKRAGRNLDRAIIGVLVLVILVMAAERFWIARETPAVIATGAELQEPGPAPPGPPPAPREKSIAVLPFVNHSAAGENTRFFSDGIHDDLLTNLSRIQELKVISRTSVMAYRDTTKNMREIGLELGVGNLLEGRVQQAGNRIRINVQLIDAATDDHIWAETYDTEISTDSIFRIQGEIARAIAMELEATLSSEENQRLERAPTTSLDAYRAVLLSRQYERRNGFDALEKSAEYAREAIELDPEYAGAHIALAFALTTGINNGALGRRETAPEIRAAVDRAMEIDPEDPAAWSVLGYYRLVTRQPGFIEAFDRSLQLDPGNAETMSGYGYALQVAKKPEKSLGLLLAAAELDPLSVNTLFALGRAYSMLGDFEEARSVFARIRQSDPGSPLGYYPVGTSYMEEGKLDQALYWLGQGQAMDPADFELAGWMLFLFDNLEHLDSARLWSEWLDGRITKQPQPMAMQAKHHYLNGNFETALQYANLAINFDLENRWNSETTFMRIKRDEAIANGNPASGIKLFQERYPSLRQDEPRLTLNILQQAVHLALLLSLDSQKEKARQLLEAAIEVYDRPYAIAGPQNMGLAPLKAEALAILGRKEEALEELRRLIEAGWRINWRWSTDMNASFNGIRDTTSFRTMVQELAIDIAAQRIAVEEMEAEGKIALPSEPQTGLDMEEPKATRRPRLGKSSKAQTEKEVRFCRRQRSADWMSLRVSGTRGAVRSWHAVERSRLPAKPGAGKRDSLFFQ